MSKTRLVGVPADMLTEAWPAVEAYVTQACDASRGRFTPADMCKKIVSRDFQLWAEQTDAGDVCAIGVTRLVRYPQLLACEFLACVGEDMAGWVGHMEQIENWARHQGATQNHLVARNGWARVMKAQGYEHTHSLLEKSLCR